MNSNENKHRETITQILKCFTEKQKRKEKNTMKNKIFTIITNTLAKRRNTCIICNEAIEKGNEVVKITTAKNTFAVCPNCYKKTRIIRKSVINTAKNTVNNVTYYNEDMKHYAITVETTNENTRAYFMCNNWFFGDTKDYTLGLLKPNNFQAASPMLDTIFTNDKNAIVRVNGKQCFNTEDVRNVIEMKVRNATINKSVK